MDNRRVMTLKPVEEVAVGSLANRYRHPEIGATLAAAPEPGRASNLFGESGKAGCRRNRL